MQEIFEYANGIKCYRADIFNTALTRYTQTGIKLHEPIEEEVFNHICSKDTINSFIDIGSAWGYYAFLAKQHNPEMKIITFDPDKNMCESVKRGMKLNSVNDIDIRNEYISNRKENTYSCAGVKQIDKDKHNTSLEDVINEFEEVDLVKIDIQGLGGLAMASGLDVIHKVNHFIIGTHGLSESNPCLEMLKAKGFEIVINLNSVPLQPDGLIWARSKKSRISEEDNQKLFQKMKNFSR